VTDRLFELMLAILPDVIIERINPFGVRSEPCLARHIEGEMDAQAVSMRGRIDEP
jgi:hypothetical protein